jgi:hypothetical protein
MAIRRTAMGGSVDIDVLRLSNENTIAIGNAKTNARGDQLGPGGKIVKTRAQLMQEYHKLNTPIAADDEIMTAAPTNLLQPIAEDTPVATTSADPTPSTKRK